MQEVQPIRATGFVLLGMLTLGLTDNTMPHFTGETSLWQFHGLRAALVLPVVAALAALAGTPLWPRRPLAVAARSFCVGFSMLLYFGALAFLPIGVVVAGLFTAPLFVLILTALFRRQPVGAVRWAAVLLGFLGALLVIQPEEGGLNLLALVPIVAGFFYAVGAVATRSWCEGEATSTLVFGFFFALLLMGLGGLAVLSLWPAAAPVGPDGFLLRGWTGISGGFAFWIAVQAVGSLIGIACLTRGYQIGEASYVAINEYSLILFATFFAWLFWGQSVGVAALLGMGLIVVSGSVIALRAREGAR